ncbi:hypothetical protein [Lewinella sp. 4G2]|uniref:hypothetical protein n=1 Tax=Lewinella sp. 4G2 TaxID=1803372 RepID=UPI0007B460C2|nr:hypothetical protein [Lewinella sp. 4G2]OAV43835.1 hypothetical protein A3850_004670 [Lewinella sp. 4G2]
MSRLFVLVLVCFSFSLAGQDVEGFFGDIRKRIQNKEYFKISGSASARAGLNFFDDRGSGAPQRNQNSNYGFNAGLNLDFLGIKAPFTAAFSNGNALYNLPSYGFAGLSPSYKWITLHAGDRSMNFSPYSLSGVNFRGGGFELKPGKFEISGMMGKLRRARIEDAGSIQDIETAYRRVGQGLKVGFNNEGTKVSASLFASSDRLTLDEEDLDPQLNASPERNMVLTLSGEQKISKLLKVSGEWARSVLTRDENALDLDDPTGQTRLFGLFDPNATTTAADAYNVAVTLSPSFGDLNLRYERVEPEYSTHGSLFFQNDLENITTGITAPLFDNKVTLTANVGLQRNDLDNSAAANNRRFIGSLNANYTASDRLNLNASFSNFTTTNRHKAIAVNNLLVDSVVIAQTQQSVDLTASYLLDALGENVLIASGSYQRAALIRDEEVDQDQLSNFSMLMLSYARQKQEARGSLTGTLLFHRNATPDLNITTVGPNVGYNLQVLGEDGSVGINAGYQIAFTTFLDQPGLESSSDGVLQSGLNFSYQITEKQTVNAMASFINAGGSEARPGYSDVQLGINYGFSF